jgi:hypothetical protein
MSAIRLFGPSMNELPLKNEYRSNRCGNRHKTLRHPRDEIDLVGHMHSPLIEKDLTVNRLNRR